MIKERDIVKVKIDNLIKAGYNLKTPHIYDLYY